MNRPPLLALLVAAGIVGLGVLAAFSPYPHPHLIIAASTDRTSYAPSQSVEVTISVWVGGNAPVTFVGRDCAWLGFVVEAAGGGLVYNSMYHVACLQYGAISITLQPGEKLVERITWTQVNDSGLPVPSNHAYEISPALALSSPVPVSIVSIRIVVG